MAESSGERHPEELEVSAWRAVLLPLQIAKLAVDEVYGKRQPAELEVTAW